MKDEILALTARSLFLSHGIVCFWKVQSVWPDLFYVWFLLVPILTLMAEGLYTVAMRGGEEYNWVSPCILLYLLCVVPPIWFLEAAEYFEDMETHVCNVDWRTGDDRGCMYDFGHINGMKAKYPIINDLLNDEFVFSVACQMEYEFRYDTARFFNITRADPYDYTAEGFDPEKTLDSDKVVYWNYNFQVTDYKGEEDETMKQFEPSDWNDKERRKQIMKWTGEKQVTFGHHNGSMLDWKIYQDQKRRDRERKEKEKADKKKKKYEEECQEYQDGLEVDEEDNYVDPLLNEDHKCYYFIFETTPSPEQLALEAQQAAAASGQQLASLGLGGGAFGGMAGGDLNDLAGLAGDNADLANAAGMGADLVGSTTNTLNEFFEGYGFVTRTWIILFHQAMLFILIIGRWMLPKNEKVSRDALSSILLTFIGVAADMLEFVTETGKEVEIKCDLTLLMLILLIWSWATIQFTLVLTGSNKPTTRQVPIYDSKHASPIMWIEEEIERSAWEKFVFKVCYST